jgi:hypothetical protein
MSGEILQYEKMIEEALQGVVREAIAQVAKRKSLPGDHHFYITFHTRHPGVSIPDSLKLQHPREMTIVIQHQFWDLETDADGFSVSLSFNRVRERLRIPFAAISAFADPSVKFGLHFQVDMQDGQPVELPPKEERPADASPAEAGEERGKVIALDAFRKK